jgi:hypothetical protein
MRLARTSNHFAGCLGVGIADAMLARGQIEVDHDGGTVIKRGRGFFKRFGVAVSPATGAERVFCRPCLDCSERRPHLAGSLGAGPPLFQARLVQEDRGGAGVFGHAKGQAGISESIPLPSRVGITLYAALSATLSPLTPALGVSNRIASPVSYNCIN